MEEESKPITIRPVTPEGRREILEKFRTGEYPRSGLGRALVNRVIEVNGIQSIEDAVAAIPLEEREHLELPKLTPREPDPGYWDRMGAE